MNVRGLIRWFCMRTGKCELLFKSLGVPDHFEYAEWLRRHRGMQIGPGTSINPLVRFTDNGAVSIGKECSVSWAEFLTHSGGDRIIGPRWNVYAASLRPIVIGDHCVIGAGARILGGVTIGDDCVIGAGAHISRDVPSGTVMKPVEAIPAGTTEAYARRLHARRPRSGVHGSNVSSPALGFANVDRAPLPRHGLLGDGRRKNAVRR